MLLRGSEGNFSRNGKKYGRKQERKKMAGIELKVEVIKWGRNGIFSYEEGWAQKGLNVSERRIVGQSHNPTETAALVASTELGKVGSSGGFFEAGSTQLAGS